MLNKFNSINFGVRKEVPTYKMLQEEWKQLKDLTVFLRCPFIYYLEHISYVLGKEAELKLFMALLARSKFHVYAKKISTRITRYHMHYDIEKVPIIDRICYFLPKTESDGVLGDKVFTTHGNERYNLVYRLEWTFKLKCIHYLNVLTAVGMVCFVCKEIWNNDDEKSSGLFQELKESYSKIKEETNTEPSVLINKDEGLSSNTKYPPVLLHSENEKKEKEKEQNFFLGYLKDPNNPILILSVMSVWLIALTYVRKSIVLSSYRNGSNYLTYLYHPFSNNLKCVPHTRGECHFKTNKMLFKHIIHKQRVIMFPEKFISQEEENRFIL